MLQQEFHLSKVLCHHPAGDCSSHISHRWNVIEACLGNALRDIVQRFVIYIARDVEYLLEVFTPSCYNSLAIKEGLHSTYLLISGEQVPSSWVPTLPSVHCRSPSCRLCQQLSAAPLLSFPTSLTSVHGCDFMAVCRQFCMLQWWILCSWYGTLSGGFGIFCS